MNLDSPSWQGVGAILTAAGILVALLIYWLQKPKRAISYFAGKPQPIIASQAGKAFGIVVTAGGQNLNDPQLLRIRIWNAGRTELEASDFFEPLLVQFSPKTTLHAATPQGIGKSSFSVNVSMTNNAIKIDPLLLNQDDKIDIVCLVTGDSNAPTVTARIKGVTEIKSVSEDKVASYATHFLSHIGLMAALLSVFTLLKSSESLISVLLNIAKFLTPN